MNIKTTLCMLFLCCGLSLLSHAESVSKPETCRIDSSKAALERGVVHYKYAGNGPAILLLHGLFAQKEQWDRWLCQLSAAGYRAIALDLPGYGQSTGFPVSDYALENQEELLEQFRSQLALQSFHLAGNSMGGAIAALHARKRPGQVQSLALIGSPLGIVEWGPSVKKALREGINPFIPTNSSELELEMRLLFAQPPALPAEVRDFLIKDYTERNRHFQQVWNIANLYGNILRQPAVQSPRTLVLWGVNDAIFDIAGAHQLLRPYPKAQLIKLANTGHLPHLESPETSAQIYLRFLERKVPLPHRP